MSIPSRRASVAGFLTSTLLGFTVAHSAEPPTTVAPFESARRPLRIDGRLHDWDHVPVLLELDGDGGSRTQASVRAALWHGAGLALAGSVPDVDPVFEATAETLHRGDHLVLWVTAMPGVPMPGIGWGSHHGEFTIEGETAEDVFVSQYYPVSDDAVRHYLRSWVTGQKLHRERVRRLFQRRWKVAPPVVQRRGVVLEDLATPAFAGLDLRAAGIFEPLRPRGGPEVAAVVSREKSGESVQPGYSFEILLPWSSLPPVASLPFEELFLRLEVHRPHPESEEPDRELAWPHDAEPGVWSRLSLERPVDFTVGECDAPLRGLDRYGAWHPAFFVPGLASNRLVDEVYVLANEARAYQDQPESLSPVLMPTEFFSRKVAEGEFVCGPALTWSRQGRGLALAEDPSRLSEEGLGRRVSSSMEARRDGDDLLVKLGPERGSRTPFGNGMCGACYVSKLRILRFGPGGSSEVLFDYYRVQDFDPADIDIHVSPDWSTVEIFEDRHSRTSPGCRWERTTHCLEDGEYRVCGETETVPEPEVRVLRDIGKH